MAALSVREVIVNVCKAPHPCMCAFTSPPIPIPRHTDDLHDCNNFLFPLALGVYHTGVEVGNMEYSFSNEGIFKCTPKNAPPPARLRQSVVVGLHGGSANEVSQVVAALRNDFAPGTYHVLKNNCNVFSNEFCMRLIGVLIARWINRLANVGKWFMLEGDPKLEDGAAEEDPDSDPRHQKKELTEEQKRLLSRFKK